MNENGDEIVFEGIHDPTRSICFEYLTLSLMIVFSLGLVLLFLPFIIAIIYFNEFRNWRLYITHSDLHYTASGVNTQ